MTLPFGEVSAALSVHGPSPEWDDEATPAVLPIEAFRPSESDDAFAGSSEEALADEPSLALVGQLLDEAIGVAHELGVAVRKLWLAGSGGGHYWRSGVLQVVLDRECPTEQQLATLANALRGERRLAGMQMSSELTDFLDFRRAA